MQEILSKTDNASAPLKTQEFYELRLDDSDDLSKGRQVIRQSHARWDEAEGWVVWGQSEIEYVETLKEAKRRYEARRAALGLQGFIYSDMDW